MKQIIINGLLSGVLLATGACSPQMQDDDHVRLPGDKDDNADPSGGKADGWDPANDPRRLSQNLNYVLAELPLSGKLDNPVWADRYEVLPNDEFIWAASYWPTAEGSVNHRWQGNDVPSPMEKYDAAENGSEICDMPAKVCGDNAKAEWQAYYDCAGPAAKYQSKTFQNGYRMHDGVDNNDDGDIDECSYDSYDGIETWWGVCHAWAPVAILEPEPQHAVTYKGQTFEVSDIKGLLMVVYDNTNAVMLGGRCNSKEIDHDDVGRATDDDCRDVNPGALHVILTNFLGINDVALVEDRTANFQVWNQPMFGYEISLQEKVTAERANTCIGAEGDTYSYNDDAVELYEVKIKTDYITEGSQSTTPLGMTGYVRHDNYHYILEVDDRGKVIGGEYCKSSQNSHPDFLWAPIRAGSSWGRNPHVDLDTVRTLLRMSREPEGSDDPPPAGDTRDFANDTSVAIPDNDPSGVTSDISVSDQFAFTNLSVSVDITHTWRGDLLVELLHDGQLVATLHDKDGGSADDLNETYTLSPTDLGVTDGTGAWTLRASDHAGQDTGTLDSFRLSFQVE
jgi:hypothetical protein